VKGKKPRQRQMAEAAKLMSRQGPGFNPITNYVPCVINPLGAVYGAELRGRGTKDWRGRRMESTAHATANR